MPGPRLPLRGALLLALCLGAGCPADPPAPAGSAVDGRDPAAPTPEGARPDAQAAYLRGVELLKAEQVDAAEAAFREALEAEPSTYKAHFKLGVCASLRHDADAERAAYRRCLEIAPDYVPALLNLGHASLGIDDLEAAQDAYVKVLALDPGAEIARFNLGLVQFDLEAFADAERTLGEFLARHPDSAHAARAREFAALAHERASEPASPGEDDGQSPGR